MNAGVGGARAVRRGILLLTTVLAIGVCARSGAHAEDASRVYAFHITGQPLSESLHEFSDVAGQQIIFSEDIVRGVQAPPLRGAYTIDQALKILLANTRLVIARTPSGIIMVKAPVSGGRERRTGGAEGTAPSQAPAATSPASTASGKRSDHPGFPEKIEEVVVTGTLIRGIAPIGSNVIGLTREDVAATGAMSTVEVLKNIPQIAQFDGPDVGLAVNTQITVNRPNLRNLPNVQTSSTNPTLILLDGHRIVSAGIKQTAPDPDVLPPGVIERVEVMPDGGSATYGTDAVGGVINFITRRHFQGIEADARYGFADNYRSFDAYGTAGHDWNRGSAYVSYNFSKNDAIYGYDRDFVRRFDTSGGANPDLTCNPGNVTIRSGLAQTTYAIPALIPNTANKCDISDDQTFTPATERHAVYAALSEAATDSVALDVSGFYSRRTIDYFNTLRSTGTVTAANPFFRRTADNPSPDPPQPQSLAFNWEPILGRDTARSRTTVESWGFTPTLTADLGDRWQVRAMFNYGRGSTLADDNTLNTAAVAQALAGSTAQTALNPYDLAATNPQVLANITNWKFFAVGKQELINQRVVADGKLLSLPGGDVRLALGLEYLRETYKAKQANLAVGAETTLPFHQGATRNNKSIFAEIAVPLVGATNARSALQSLSLSLSGRYDDYSDFGGTFNPKIAFTYEPLPGLKLRGNWGTSFNAPSLADSVGGAVDAGILIVNASVLPSPLPGQFSPAQASWPVVILQGGAPGIGPQTAKTKEIGADIQPSSLPGTTFSVTYFHIHFKDLIGFPPVSNLLDYYRYYGPYYTLNPTQAQVLAAAQLATDGVASVTPLLAPGALPIYAVEDARRRNLGRAKLGGLDFAIRYIHPTSFGSIDAGVAGSYDLQRESQPLAGIPWIDNLSSDINRFRFQANLGVHVGHLRAEAIWQHRHGHDITPTVANNNQAYASSFNLVNLFFRYDLEGPRLLRDASLSLNINNLFDQDPPLYRGTSQTTIGHGYTNGTTLGRYIQVGLRKQF